VGVASFQADSGGDGRKNRVMLIVAFGSCGLNVPENCGLDVLSFKVFYGGCEVFFVDMLYIIVS
jgi:hypothetical protein